MNELGHASKLTTQDITNHLVMNCKIFKIGFWCRKTISRNKKSHWDIVRSFCSKRNKRRNLKFTSDLSDDRSTEYYLSLNKLQNARFEAHKIWKSWSCIEHIQADSERKVIAEKAIIRRLFNHWTFSSINLLFFWHFIFFSKDETHKRSNF